MEVENVLKQCQGEVETSLIEDLLHAASTKPFEQSNYHQNFMLRELWDQPWDLGFHQQHDAHGPHFFHQRWPNPNHFLQIHNSEHEAYHHDPHHHAVTDLHHIRTEDDLQLGHHHQVHQFHEPIHVLPLKTHQNPLIHHREPLQIRVADSNDKSPHLLEADLHQNHHHIQAVLGKLRDGHSDERYKRGSNSNFHRRISKRSLFGNWNQPKLLHFPAVISQADRFYTGCLLQCVFRKKHAVDKFGYPTLHGLANFFTAGTHDHSFFVYVLESVNKCLKIASHKHQIYSRNTCEVSFEVFYCVYDFITEFCISADHHYRDHHRIVF